MHQVRIVVDERLIETKDAAIVRIGHVDAVGPIYRDSQWVAQRVARWRVQSAAGTVTIRRNEIGLSKHPARAEPGGLPAGCKGRKRVVIFQQSIVAGVRDVHVARAVHRYCRGRAQGSPRRLAPGITCRGAEVLLADHQIGRGAVCKRRRVAVSEHAIVFGVGDIEAIGTRAAVEPQRQRCGKPLRTSAHGVTAVTSLTQNPCARGVFPAWGRLSGYQQGRDQPRQQHSDPHLRSVLIHRPEPSLK